MRRIAQRDKFFCGVFELQEGIHLRVHLGPGRTIILLGKIEHQNFLTHFFEDTCLGFLSQRALPNQRRQPWRRNKVAVPRVIGQGFVHGFYHMGHNIQPHHVGRAIGGTLGAANPRSRQRIHLIKSKAQSRSVMDHGQYGKNTDSVGDKIRSIQSPYHPLTQA